MIKKRRQKLDVAFIRTCRLGLADPRLMKEAITLKKYGYNILILAWDRTASHAETEVIRGIQQMNFLFKAPVSSYFLVFFYPFFWIWVFNKIVSLRPRIVHACNLDSAIIAYVCRKLGLCEKFVFDVFDSFLFFIPLKNLYSLLFRTIYALENYLFYVADMGIIPSEDRSKLYRRFNKKEITIITNSPPDLLRNLKNSVNGRKNIFSVVYAGSLSKVRGILELIESTQNLGVTLILAGPVIDYSILYECKKHKHVKYLGILTHEKSLEIEANSDCLVALYDPLKRPLSYKFAEPQKIYEAMVLGKPLITNVKKDIVKRYKCGIVVKYGNTAELKRAIKFLKDNPKVAYEMGLNGRKAYEAYFHWNEQCKKLISVYRRLLVDCHEQESKKDK